MVILKATPQIRSLEITGSKFVRGKITTEYSYRLTPQHPIDKSWFVVYTTTIIKTLSNSQLICKAEALFQFDNEGVKPKVRELLDMTKQSVVKLNELLNEKITETDLRPNRIQDIDEPETIEALRECLLIAYPNN